MPDQAKLPVLIINTPYPPTLFARAKKLAELFASGLARLGHAARSLRSGGMRAIVAGRGGADYVAELHQHAARDDAVSERAVLTHLMAPPLNPATTLSNRHPPQRVSTTREQPDGGDARPPHVVLINHLYDPDILGGAEIMVEGLARQLQQKGWRVSVIATARDDDCSTVAGIDVHRMRIPNVYWLKDGGPRSRSVKLIWRLVNLWNPMVGPRLGRLLDRLQPDIVHTHNVVSFSPIVWAVAKQRRLPLVHTAHDYHLLCPNWSLLSRSGKLCTHPTAACRLYRQWHVRQAARIDTFCSPSNFLLSQHRPWLREHTRMIHLPNGIAMPPVAAEPAHPTQGAPLNFLLLCQLLPSKGVAVVLEAMRILPDDAKVELHIAGVGPLESSVRTAAEMDRRIVYHGFVSGVAKEAIIAASQVLLYPSLWYENGPYSLMEAAAAGLAVLGSDLGATPEFVEENVNGHLFPAGDAAALAARMMALSGDPMHVLALRRGARVRAPAYAEELMVQAYLREYQLLMPRDIIVQPQHWAAAS